ncbi:MAG: serine/threonine-protein kinase [Cyanobacteria bacterium P01_G01_bin.67]
MLEQKLTKIGDRYDIQQQLSQKAGRSTYLARDRDANKLVIIKVLEFNSLFQWDDLKLFEREAQTLKNLDHPAIPKYLDYFEITQEKMQGFALVQTFIDAPSLATTIQQGRKYSEAELIELAKKLLTILTYLHQQNPPVIHRDIKPSNILITNRTGNSVGELYLVDFGSVQTVASKSEGTITIVGSYGYIPLEQFGGQTVPASDLYSLGMTLIYLITGVHPAELPQKKGRVEFEASDLSGKFARWLEKMTNPHLDQRFESTKSAQIALLSKDGSSGDFLNLRPGDSRIKLYRDRHKLEITYPEKIPQSLGYLIVTILCIIGIFVYGIRVAFLGFIISSIISKFLISIFPDQAYCRTILIDDLGTINTKYHEQKFNESQWNKNHISYRKISFITYNPGYTFDRYLDDQSKEIRRGKVEVKPKLSIYIGQSECSIGNDQFSQAELWWLGKEISDFIGQELQVIYPTPKAPPEFSCGGGC